MKTTLVIIIMLIKSVIFAQNIDCELLKKIEYNGTKKSIENTYSKEKIIIEESKKEGVFVSESEIKITNGSYGHNSKNSFFIASISKCDEFITKEKTNIYSNEKEQMKDPIIKIYPNPSKEIVNVYWENINVNLISLFTIEGKEINNYITENKNETLIDITNLSEGIYIIKIQNDKIIKNYYIIRN